MGKKEQTTKEKPLEKMTATELRDVAKDIPEIVGAHGMNKTELVSAIKEARGIVDESKKRGGGDVRKIKKQMKAAKGQYKAALDKDDTKMAGIYRKRMIRLKKKTRRVA